MEAASASCRAIDRLWPSLRSTPPDYQGARLTSDTVASGEDRSGSIRPMTTQSSTPSSQMLRGVVEPNPERQPGRGDWELTIKPMLFPIEAAQKHFAVNNWGIFAGAVLAVAFPAPDRANMYGSAVLVAPGIAIGAMHVFDEARQRVMAAEVGAMCFGVCEDRIIIWRITQVTSHAGDRSDLAIFSLELASELPPDQTFTVAILSTRTPAIGERLTIVGFRHSNAEELSAGPERELHLQLLYSAGPVVHQYPQQRDSFGLPCPCVEVDCHAPGGMSGGPVFDPQGRLVGILSRGLDQGPSWVLLLWPALGWSFGGGWPAQVMVGERRLVDLNDGRCTIERPDAVSIEGDVAKLRYEQWTVSAR